MGLHKLFIVHVCVLVCRKAREDEKAASKRLAEMVANYGDVIPRRDFEALEKKYKVDSFIVLLILVYHSLSTNEPV